MKSQEDVKKALEKLRALKPKMFRKDFFLTWEQSEENLKATLLVADILRALRKQNFATRLFDNGLCISLFRDQSTRTRFSLSSASNLLGLAVQDLDEKKSQIAHGETVRESANMISFMAEAIGIRDDMYLGEGNKYMREVASALNDGFRKGVLPQRPAIVNCQCDIDHPTQAMADLLHLVHTYGGVEKLKGKKIAMTWAYSPSYGKPLSVPQGIVGLMTRFGMKVSLAYPKGYDLLPEVIRVSKQNAKKSGGSLKISHSMKEAFRGADIVYPKSWAPWTVMKKRVPLMHAGDEAGLKDLETKCLAQNAQHKDWECTEAMMKGTKQGKALYMHCLPADITGVSCKAGEVSKKVFEQNRIETYKEAGYKPYIIAAMITLARFKNPAKVFEGLLEADRRRILS